MSTDIPGLPLVELPDSMSTPDALEPATILGSLLTGRAQVG